MRDWKSSWVTDAHIETKRQRYKMILDYLGEAPKTILDIGCGFAYESRFFAKEHGTEIYLIDGNPDIKKKRDVVFGSVDTFAFYNTLEDIRKELDKDNIKYTLIDVNNLEQLKNKKFDVICSWKSCGFHYPIDTYKDLCIKHSHKNTKLLFDIRKGNEKGCEIVKVICDDPKSKNCEIKFSK